MKGITLLKNIQRKIVKNGDKFIYKEEKSLFNGQEVSYENELLYFCESKCVVSSANLLNGEFIYKEEYEKDMEIINWLEKNMQVNNLFFFKQDSNDPNIISCYYKCTNTYFCDFYKDKIFSLIKNQEEVI